MNKRKHPCLEWDSSLVIGTNTYNIQSSLFYFSHKILYRFSQEERLICWEVILIKKCIYTCVLFRTVSEINLFHSRVQKLLTWKRYYVLSLIPIFIVQVTKLVEFTYHNTFKKIPTSTSMHFATHVKTWRVARLSASWCSFMRAIIWNSAISETVRNRTHVHIHYLLTMSDTMTSQNIHLLSWDILYNPKLW
jgi:hypothetical protein